MEWVLPSLGMSPREQVMVPLAPTAGVVQLVAPETDTKVNPAGRGSLTWTAWAVEGPLLVVARVNVMLAPGTAWVAVLVMATSAEALTSTLPVPVLLADMGSGVVLDAVAEFDRVPVKAGPMMPLTVTVATPPGASGPKEQVMVAPTIEHVPRLGVTVV